MIEKFCFHFILIQKHFEEQNYMLLKYKKALFTYKKVHILNFFWKMIFNYKYNDFLVKNLKT